MRYQTKYQQPEFPLLSRRYRPHPSRLMSLGWKKKDEGDLDMFQVLSTLKEVNYRYLIMPDHMPRHRDDPKSRQAFAFAYGYIQGLLQALDSQADYSRVK